jgi:adenylosuccinate synthase
MKEKKDGRHEQALTVFGCQWGDEGKGKLVDWLADSYDVVVRFQGGHNAGHTLVVDGKTVKLNVLPSGVVRKDCVNVVGNGVVVDPFALVEEMGRLEDLGYGLDSERLRLSERAHMILPVHVELDCARELQAEKGKIGTTGRGIGPAYEDKVGRRGFRLGDLRDIGGMRADVRMRSLLWHHNALRVSLGLAEVGEDFILEGLAGISELLLPYVGDVSRELGAWRSGGKSVLFEGAQGAMLDMDYGTYPYVTSSNTLPGQVATGSGLFMEGYVLGVAKAYTTRVGSGPMVSDLSGTGEGILLRDRGEEYGTVTGRERRCGWFDLVQMRHVCQLGGVDGLALTKLDVLDGFDEIYVCEAYEYGGERFYEMPLDVRVQEAAKPVWRKFSGWKGKSHVGVRRREDVASEALSYVSYLEEALEVSIEFLSVGASRDATIVMKDLTF